MKKILQIIGIILVIVPFGRMLYYSFTHIDMTSMRIFVNNWYWYIPLIIGWLLIEFSKEKK